MTRRSFFGFVAALAAFGPKAIYALASARPKPRFPRWSNWTMQYTDFDPAELQSRMRAAFKKMDLQPPIYCSPETLKELIRRREEEALDSLEEMAYGARVGP